MKENLCERIVFLCREPVDKLPGLIINQGRIYAATATLIFQEPCRLSDKNVRFRSKLFGIEEKSVCFGEK